MEKLESESHGTAALHIAMKEIEDGSNCLSHSARLWRLNRDSADGQVLLGGCYSVLSCCGAEDSVKCL